MVLRSLVLYIALGLCANAAPAADIATLEAMREGTMKKLVFHAEPQAVPDAVLLDETDAERSLGEYRGRWVVLNFWGTWCPPCLAEMPTLEALAATADSDRLAVVTVATGRNPPQAIDRWFSEQQIAHLPKWRDQSSWLARSMGILALPVTVILDPEGREVGRMMGEADWNGPEARALLGSLAEGS
ncbi:TlpA family protein disulfide reductase [Rhodovulum visakhapatnamense]|uniref:Thiol-disulfide isomerase/thioredoxin n=1 Tax=Rhodovulum visakhapatnamense TaxID=364297 RepID=A0A4R8FUC3_9RHOB|nr:TlpA disulfide reductase family protein [Rhodovulum visakhapatnamense]TDX27748.1 thiol-disulfide isomerase/thioredoxin [Rhodovulum visakhapatnamense]